MSPVLGSGEYSRGGVPNAPKDSCDAIQHDTLRLESPRRLRPERISSAWAPFRFSTASAARPITSFYEGIRSDPAWSTRLSPPTELQRKAVDSVISPF